MVKNGIYVLEPCAFPKKMFKRHELPTSWPDGMVIVEKINPTPTPTPEPIPSDEIWMNVNVSERMAERLSNGDFGANLVEIVTEDGKSKAIFDGPITKIGNGVFCYDQSLTEFVMPDTVTTIGSSAFEGCMSMTSLTFGENLTYIGSMAFRDCRGLKEIIMPDSITGVDYCTFCGCHDVEKIHISTGLSVMPDSMFWDCPKLVSVEIPDNITEMGTNCFQNCPNLKEVKIGKNVQSIAKEVFEFCGSLEKITCMSESIVPTIHKYTFSSVKENGVLYHREGLDFSQWMSTDDDYLGKYNWTEETF